MRFRFLIPFVSLHLLFLNCDQPFSPKGTFTEELVVYTILTDVSDEQFARIFRTYDPPGFDPFEHLTDNQVPGAQVSVMVDQVRIAFRDTQVVRSDSSRYSGLIDAYVASPFRAEKGKIYTLDVLSPDGKSVTASAQLPGGGQIQVSNSSALLQPRTTTHSSVGLAAFLSPVAKGFILRFYLSYEVLESAVWVPYTTEVPLAILHHEDGEEVIVWPALTRSPDSGTGYAVATQYFDIIAYRRALTGIFSDHVGSIRFNTATFILTQVEKHLYNYYGVANGFRDPNTIRLDEPEYSNIASGAGVFGGFVQDTLIVPLPPVL